MLYSIDTSGILDAWDRWHPIDVFPSLWTQIEISIEQKIIVATDEVLEEFKRKDDRVLAWVESHGAMFLPLDEEIQITATEILREFPRMVDERTGKSMGDPFVVAVAKIHNLKVVTGEKGGTAMRPKIPNVCQHFGIEAISIVDMMRELKYSI